MDHFTFAGRSMAEFAVAVALVCACAGSLQASGVVSCSADPSGLACAPNVSLTYRVGNGPVQSIDSSAPVFSGGEWQMSFDPLTIPFLFTGGSVRSSPDPFVAFSFSFTNNSIASLTFNYDFSTPYAGGTYTQIRSVFNDSLLNADFSGQTAVTPVGGAYLMYTYVDGVLAPAVDLGQGCTAINVCTSPDDGTIGPLGYLSAAAGTLEVKGSFTVSKGGQYTLTGRTDLLGAPADPGAPEPGTMALLGIGVVGLVGRRRLRGTRQETLRPSKP